MRSYPWRAAIGRLAFLVSSIAVGACADQSITAPAARPDVVSVAAGDVVPTADADSTRVAFTIADHHRKAWIDGETGDRLLEQQRSRFAAKTFSA